ncbi:MAG: CHAT domain-containing protein [Betaproteobacteria bacterium]|nr:CHAT domain-containing protein [Betaproteobacteria bacterium]
MEADYRQARDIAQREGWAGLARMMDDMMKRLALRRKLSHSMAQVQGAVKNLFNPRTAREVLVNEQFVARDQTNAAQLEVMFRQLVQENARLGPYAELTGYRMHVTDAHLRQLRGDKAGAVQAFGKAIDLIERDRRGLAEERARAAYLRDKVVVYDGAIAELLDQKRHAEAFDLMERSRSRALSALLAKKELVLGSAQERTAYGKSLELRSRIARLQNDHFALAAGKDASPRQLAGYSTQIRQLEAEHGKLLSQLEQQSPKLKELVESRPARLSELQKAARAEGFEVLQYLVRDNDVVLWYIGAERVEVRAVFLTRAALVEKVAALQASLANPQTAFDERIARQLYLFLLEPARAWLTGKRVVVIPHDVLHVLPFQALIAPGGEPWGAGAQITYAPSATVLLGLAPARQIKDGKMLAIADPSIPAAREEVRAIGALYPGSKVEFGRLTTEGEVKAWAKDYNLLHLSVHGKFDASEPLFSHLAFARGGQSDQDDGKLTAAEIFGLPLEGAQLVVLSACETGRAEVTRGDEVMGLTRAFLYAGAQRLIVSQWNVSSESTRLWMETFYREAQRELPAEAARRALIAVRSNKAFSHPHYWAAFTMVGR